MDKNSLSFTITTDGKKVVLTRSRREDPLCSGSYTAGDVAFIFRRLAFYALQQAHRAETLALLQQEPFTPSAMAAQVEKLLNETDYLTEDVGTERVHSDVFSPPDDRTWSPERICEP